MYVVWGKLAIEDVDPIIEEIKRVSGESGASITYITRVPADAEAPGAAEQKVINQRLATVRDKFATYHVVLEGTGFVAAAKRSVLAMMFLAQGRRGVFFVHERVDEVLAHVKPEMRRGAADLLKAAEARGILVGPPPSTTESFRMGEPG